jgi:hypothetical protein
MKALYRVPTAGLARFPTCLMLLESAPARRARLEHSALQEIPRARSAGQGRTLLRPGQQPAPRALLGLTPQLWVLPKATRAASARWERTAWQAALHARRAATAHTLRWRALQATPRASSALQDGLRQWLGPTRRRRAPYALKVPTAWWGAPAVRCAPRDATRQRLDQAGVMHVLQGRPQQQLELRAKILAPSALKGHTHPKHPQPAFRAHLDSTMSLRVCQHVHNQI